MEFSVKVMKKNVLYTASLIYLHYIWYDIILYVGITYVILYSDGKNI